MTKYLISFPASAMDVSNEDLATVGEAARAVIRQAKDAGVYVFGGGINSAVAPLMVAADGTITHETYPQPLRLVDNQDKPRDYSSAMRWVIANQILFYYEDIIDGTFIDRSSPTALSYELRLNFPSEKQLKTKQLEAKFEVQWNKFE